MELGKFTWRDGVMFAIVILVAVGIYRGFVNQYRFSEQGKEAHDYLCYQKKTVIPQRIQSTLDYITAVETGERNPIPGLTNADLRSSIERDEALLRNLSRVHC